VKQGPLLFNPHTSLFSEHTYSYSNAYRTTLRYLMQTHISDSNCWITITHGSCFENEEATDSRERLLCALHYKYTSTCWFMKQYFSVAFWPADKSAGTLTLPYPALSIHVGVKNNSRQSQDNTFCVGGEPDIPK